MILKHPFTTIIPFLFFIFSNSAFAQNKLYRTSGEQYNIAIKEWQKDTPDYKFIIHTLDSINENDTLYPKALSSLAWACVQDSQFVRGVDYCNKGLALNKDYRLNFINLKGLCFKNNMQYDSALTTFKTGIASYPNNYLFESNIGNTYSLLSEWQEAYEHYKRSIEKNPYNHNGYVQLGYLLARTKHITAAALCYHMALLIAPSNSNAHARVLFLEKLIKDEYYPDSLLVVSDPDFPDYFVILDLILKNRVALDKRYAVKSDLDNHINRQSQVLFERLQNPGNDTTFWSRRLIRNFYDIWKQDIFEGYSYYYIQSVNSESLKKIIEKRSREIEKFRTWARTYIVKNINNSHYDVANPKGENIQMIFHSDNSLKGIGNADYATETPRGNWKYYKQNGEINSIGSFNAEGKRIGEWRFFHEDGNLYEVLYYDNGVLNGNYKQYNQDGILVQDYNYKNGKIDGLVLLYYSFGALSDSIYYSSGKRNGLARSYYYNGQLYSVLTNKDNRANGQSTKYFPNGKVKEEATFTDGMYDRNYVSYYSDGTIYAEGKYVFDKKEGPWKYYHQNGKIFKTATYKSDKETGELIKYNDEGLITSRSMLDESGKENGLAEIFDIDGKKYEEYDYKKGIISAYRFYNKDGQLAKSYDKTKGELNFTGYYSIGTKRVAGSFGKIGRTGIWKFYTPAEILDAQMSYNEGQLDGQRINFYNNGDTLNYEWYDGGQEEGLFTRFHPNGKPARTGYQVGGKLQGEWHTYNTYGERTEKEYYREGEFHGRNYYYTKDNKLRHVFIYDEGIYKGFEEYDADGNIMQTSLLANGTGDETLHYPNGNVSSTRTYRNCRLEKDLKFFQGKNKLLAEGKMFNHDRHGVWKWYDLKGNTTYTGEYRYGSKVGEWQYYHENGQSKIIRHYKDGERHGKDTAHYSNGSIEYIVEYYEGELHGKYSIYNPLGELICHRYYHQGTIIGYGGLDINGKETGVIPLPNGTGTVKTYFKNGKIAASIAYLNSDIHGKYIAYFSTGKVWKEMMCEYDNIQNVQTTYHPNGKIESKENYYFDNKTGAATYYYENGNIKEKCEYWDDLKHGTATHYTNNGQVAYKLLYHEGSVMEEIR
jgi:antitoxin component YwqK of YwqJK toxin-antitoxin module